MGGIVIWGAYRQAYNKSVPAPVDKTTPDAPWWYDHLASQCREFAERGGYTALMLPPVHKTESGSTIGGDGYGVFDDYDIGSKNQFYSVPTRFGTREQLMRLCAVAAANGLDIYLDMVPHQRIGGNDGRYAYAGATTRVAAMENIEAIGVDHPDYAARAEVHLRRLVRHGAPDHVIESAREQLPDTFYRLSATATGSGRFPKDKGMFCSGPTSAGWAAHDPVAGNPDFGFGDEICRVNSTPPTQPGYAQQSLIAAGDWLIRTTGAEGCRIDDTKGQNAGMVLDWCNAAAMAGKYMVGEFADGNAQNLAQWCNNSLFDRWNPGVQGRCSAFDFDAHYNKIKAMCENPGRYDMRQLAQGFVWQCPTQAATFVDNPDTDTNGFAQVAFNKILGYFLIMTFQGYPFVYYKDRSRDPGCYGLRDEIDNLAWIARVLCSGGQQVSYADHDLFVYERTGYPGVLCAMNNAPGGWRYQWVKTGFGPNVRLHDYSGHAKNDIWTNADGWVEIAVPPNVNGLGYVAFARAGLDRPMPTTPRDITQTIFGADDLDVPALRASDATTAGRIWVQAGTDIRASITLNRPVGRPLVNLVVTDPSNRVVHRGSESRQTIRADRSGWHTLQLQYVPSLRGSGSQDFELTVTYRAPKDLRI